MFGLVLVCMYVWIKNGRGWDGGLSESAGLDDIVFSVIMILFEICE